MSNIVDFNTFSTLRLLGDSIKWYKGHNADGQFDNAIRIEEGAYKQYLAVARA